VFFVAIEPNKTFTVALTLEEADHPVIFNLSIIVNGNDLLVPSKFITLSCCGIETISFDIIPEILPNENEPLENGMKLVVSASYTGIEGGSSQEKIFPLSRKSKSSTRILIQTKKYDYTVGEDVKYHVIVITDNGTQNTSYTDKPLYLKINLLNSKNHPVWYGCDEGYLPSSGVFTGSFSLRNSGEYKINAFLDGKD